MNYLAHLLLAERAGVPMAGGVLGDFVRGPTAGRFPPELETSIRLHRRIDTVTDQHPLVTDAVRRFPEASRRYAGVLLDLLYDHCLARDWRRYSDEPLPDFARRASAELEAAGPWFETVGAWTPNAWLFRRLLLSYRHTLGMERAIHRTASRLRNPQGMIDASRGWRDQLDAASADLPQLMNALQVASAAFLAAADAKAAQAPAAETASAS